MKAVTYWISEHIGETILLTLFFSFAAFLLYNSTGERAEKHHAFFEKCRVACYPNPVETALVDENRCECNMKREIRQVK